MKYRIYEKSNKYGQRLFYPQYKFKYFPFWFSYGSNIKHYVKSCSYSVTAFDNLKEAKDFIIKLKIIKHNKKSKKHKINY